MAEDCATVVVGIPNVGFVWVRFEIESILLGSVPNTGNFCSFFRDPKLIAVFVVKVDETGTG